MRRAEAQPTSMEGHADLIWATHQSYRRRGRSLRFRDLGLVSAAEGAAYGVRSYLRPSEPVLSAALLPPPPPDTAQVRVARAAAGRAGPRRLRRQPPTIDGIDRGLMGPAAGGVHDFGKGVGDRYRDDVVTTTDLPRKEKKRSRARADLLLARNLEALDHLERAHGDPASPHAVLAASGLGL